MVKIKSKDLQNLVPKLREEGFYQSKSQRKIDWPVYNLNQINDIIYTLHFIRDEVDKVYEKKHYENVGRPPIRPDNIAKAILFSELYTFPERKAEGWITLLGHHLGIDEHVDDRVLGKGYKHPEVISLLEKVFKNNRESDGKNCGDGTGLEKSRKENYESTKKKGLYMTSIVDSREIVQTFDISGKQECQIMHELVLELKEIIKTSNIKKLKLKLTLDAGFVDRKLTQIIEDCGLTPYIFPKTNLTLKSKGFPAWKTMWLNLIQKTQEWLEEYHDRSHSESFHSSFKRVFGIISKILNETIYTQVLCRIIHNNRRKISYFNKATF